MASSERWSEPSCYAHEHDGSLQRSLAAMRYAHGSEYQISGPGLGYPLADDKPRLSRDNEIEFVGPFVRVDVLHLAGLEAVEAHEQPVGAEAVELRHLGRREGRAGGHVLDQVLGGHG